MQNLKFKVISKYLRLYKRILYGALALLVVRIECCDPSRSKKYN